MKRLVTVALSLLMVVSLLLACKPTAKVEESAASFYAGKTVELYVPYKPGGGYDTWARLITPSLGKALGATVIVVNEDGAGGKVALNKLQKQSDGLSMIIFAPRAGVTSQLYGEEGVNYNLAEFNWLGIVAKDYYIVVLSTKSKYKTIADLQKAKEVKFSSDTPTSGKAIRPIVFGKIMGININLVAGYKGSADEILALQRGESDGLSTNEFSLLPYIKSGDAIPIVGMEHKRSKMLPDIPTIYELKTLTEFEKRIADVAIGLDAVGRPVATSPNVPKDRVEFLANALKKATDDPELKAKVEKLGETIEYSPGAEAAEAIKTMLAMNQEEKAIFGKLLGVPGY